MIFARDKTKPRAGTEDTRMDQMTDSASIRRNFGLWQRPPANQEPASPVASLPRFAVDATDDPGDFPGAPGARGDDQIARARVVLADMLAASQPAMASSRFAGRREAFQNLISAIEQQRAHVVLYGDRGIGKTSLIHVFAEAARDAQYLFFYGSCGVESRFDEMFRAFLAEIPLLYHASISPTADENEHSRSFADLLGDQRLDPRQLAGLLSEVVGTRIIFVLDEYDRVADIEFRRDIAELIKNLSDRAARVQLVLTGVGSNLDELIGFTPSIRRNIVGIPLGPMPDSEIMEILERAETASGIIFSTDAKGQIVRMAAGSPYYARLLGGRAAGRALDAGRMEITEHDVTAGTEAVLAEWNAGLPRRVQATLARPEVRAAWPVLIAASRLTGTPDEWFSAADIAAETGRAPQEIDRLLTGFTDEINLFERSAPVITGPAPAPAAAVVAPEPRFRFRTQGVAQLLGLSAALARAGK